MRRVQDSLEWSRRLRRTVAVIAAGVLLSLAAAAPSRAAKLFVVLADDTSERGPSGPVARFEVAGPQSSPMLETTITDPSFDLPCCLAFSSSGEMFVSNRGDGLSAGAGSITRILHSDAAPVSNGTISSPSFSGPHWAKFRAGDLFVAQRGGGNVLRFTFDARGSASLGGILSEGLFFDRPRGIAVSPRGELFVTQCCGLDMINRYLFDGAGNPVPNGVITANGLNNPHDMAFSRSGELFVANAGGNTVSRFTFDRTGNASPNGLITAAVFHTPLGLDISPWGELFVGNGDPPGGVSRWTFDRSGQARFNGTFSTPSLVVEDVQFSGQPTNRPPDCSSVRIGPTQLWPPNHRYVKVTASGAVDPDPGDLANLVIDAITQDEAVNGQGDGDTAPDAVLATPPADYAWVRAERSGRGDGRVYVLHYTATDKQGATCEGIATVSVPHDRGRDAIAPLSYDSLHP
jgi:hypothetical protein